MNSINWDAVFDEETSNEGQAELLKQIWSKGPKITFNANSFMKDVMTRMAKYEKTSNRSGEFTTSQRTALIRAARQYKTHFDLVVKLSADYPLDDLVTAARASLIISGRLSAESRRYLDDLLEKEAIRELIASGKCEFPQ